MPPEEETVPSEDNINAELEAMKKATSASLMDIADESLGEPNDETEIEETFNAVAQPQDPPARNTLPEPKSPDIPLGSGDDNIPDIPNVDDIINKVASLEDDVNNQSLDDNAGSKTKASFEGLKSKYKTAMGEFKSQLEILKQEKEALVRDASRGSKSLEEVETLGLRLKVLEQERDKYKEEAATSRHYRLKYDAENDPIIKEAFTTPMAQAKSKSGEILKSAGLDEYFWKDLLAAESVAQVNQLIDDNGITGLNALDLKNSVEVYKRSESEFNRVTSPEFIESTIAKSKGQHINRSEKRAKLLFDEVNKGYTEHIGWLKESDTNIEHNIYVHDKAVNNAQKNFASFRKRLAPEHQTDEVLAWASNMALTAAAYPFQDKYAKHLEKRVSDLQAELDEQEASPSITQTTEVSPKSDSVLGEIDRMKQEASLDIKDIASSVFLDD